MGEIKEILDEIASYSGKNDKRDCLAKYQDNELLKKVLYAANSPRINYHIKQIPIPLDMVQGESLEWALDELQTLSERKKTGDDARTHLAAVLGSLHNMDDRYVLERIIDRNLKIGMDTGINKVIPKLIEETPYMGAKSFSVKLAKKLFGYDPKKGQKIVKSQVKADGTYRNAIIQDGVVELISRQGEVSFLKGAKFLDELSFYEDCVLNGELIIDGYARYEANGMASSMMDIIEKADERGPEKTQKKMLDFAEEHGDWDEVLSKMRYVVWDVISVEEYRNCKSDTPYHQRFDRLEGMIVAYASNMVSVVESKDITTFEEAMDHFLDTQERGLEGTIIKSPYEGWKDTKPSYQVKMKLDMTIDMRVVKPLFGNVGTKYEHKINGFMLESSCGKITTTARGVKEAEMETFTKLGDDIIGDVMETKCCGLSQNKDGDWSLLHPSIVEHRTDKDTCDSLETALEIQEMAKTLENHV